MLFGCTSTKFARCIVARLTERVQYCVWAVTVSQHAMAGDKTQEQIRDELDALNAKITKQGSSVRQLKKDGKADDIGEAVELLKKLKLEAAALEEQLTGGKEDFNRKSFDELLLRKMFVVPSFEIHGGVKGLFDLGPPATALKVIAFCSNVHQLLVFHAPRGAS